MLARLSAKISTSYEEIEDAGQPFIIDGDSLLVDALASPSIDWSYGANLVQLLYQLERRLDQLLQSERRFTLVFFDILKNVWRRPSHVLAREMFIKHAPVCLENRAPVRQFDDWECKEFMYFLQGAHPSFAMTSPGGDTIAHVLSPRSVDLLRRLTVHLLANGIRVVRATQFTVVNSRLKGFQQLARDSAISDYFTMKLPELPNPNYGGVFQDISKNSEPETSNDEDWAIALPKDLVLAVKALAEYWRSKYVKGEMIHDKLSEVETKAEEEWASLASAQGRAGTFVDDSDTEDEWENKGLGDNDIEEKEGKEKMTGDAFKKKKMDEEAEEEAHLRMLRGDEITAGTDDGDDDALDNWEDFSGDDEDDEENQKEGADAQEEETLESWEAAAEGEEDASEPQMSQGPAAEGNSESEADLEEALKNERIWEATGLAAAALAAKGELTDELLIKTALLHAVLAHHLPLSDRLRRLPSIPNGGALAPFIFKNSTKIMQNPRVFMELYAAHLTSTAIRSDSSPWNYLHAIDGALFHRLLSIVLACGGIKNQQSLGLPHTVGESLESVWTAFRKSVGTDRAPSQGEFFPVSISKEQIAAIISNPTVSKAIALYNTAHSDSQVPKSAKLQKIKLLRKMETPLLEDLLTDNEKKAIVPYIQDSRSDRKEEKLLWMPPDPLEERNDEDTEEAAAEEKRRREVQERKERARQGRGGVDLNTDDKKELAARQKQIGSESATGTSEKDKRQNEQRYLTFMTKYAQSLSGTRLVLRDVIVANSSNASSKDSKNNGWQGSSGNKNKGWNPGGKKGKKGKKAGKASGAGKAMREQIIAGVDARKREEIKQNVTSYVAVARKIPLAMKQSEEDKRKKEEEALGVSFGITEESNQELENQKVKKKGPKGPTISLPALEQRIKILDERLVDIADSHVIPGLLVLLDWCVLAWCEQQAPGASFKLPSIDEKEDAESESKETKKKAATDVEMSRAVRIFHVAFDIFRRFKNDLTMVQMGRILYALLVLGFREHAEKLLKEYAEHHKLNLKDLQKKQKSCKIPLSVEGAIGDDDEHLEMSLRTLIPLGVKIIRPKNEGLPEGEEEEDDDEDEDEEEDEFSNRKGLSRKERELLEKKARVQRSEAQRRYRQLAYPDHRVNMTPERFQLTFGGPKMVRDVQSAPDPRVSGFYPDAWQREMLDVVDRRGSALIVAPTSSGKTFASFYAMKKILTHNKQTKLRTTGLLSGPLLVVYVCPTTALVSQVAAGVYRRYGAVFGVLAPGLQYKTESCEVLVTLPECLEDILLSPQREAWVARVKYVIFDEVHSLDGSRGEPWERLLAAFPSPFLALSATVGNPKAFHSWLVKARARTASVPKLHEPDASQTSKSDAGGNKGSSGIRKKGKKTSGRRGKGSTEEEEEEKADPFPNDNPEVALIIHSKRWADLEKAVYLPVAQRKSLIESYEHGIIVPKTNAERALLKLSGRKIPSLLPSGLLPFHPLAAVAFGASEFNSKNKFGAASISSVPSTMEFSPKDSMTLYDHMSKAAASSSGAIAKSLKQLAPEAYFRSSSYIGRDAAHEYGDKVKEAFSTWAQSDPNTETQKQGHPARNTLERLAAPIREGLTIITDNQESLSSRNFVMRYALPLFVDLAREDKLPAVAFCLDPNMCEALAKRLVLSLEQLEKDAFNREGGMAEKRRLARMARKATKLVKRMRDKRGGSASDTASSAGGAQGKKLSHEEIARREIAREQARRRDEEVHLAASKLDQDELDQLMDVDTRFSFVPDTDRISREDLDFWLDRLRKTTQWPVGHPLLRALWRGIGVHHAGLPRSYKDLVETMFRGKHIKIVIATGTLAVGVNMPSRTTAFLGDSPFLTPLAFRQMAGRAGRRGHDDVGYVAFLGVPMQKVASLMTSPLTSLRGRYPGSVLLALRMTLFQSAAKVPERATKLVNNMLKVSPLELPGAGYAGRQARLAFRFSLEHLWRLQLLDSDGRPTGLAGLAAFLHSAGPGALALVKLIRSGSLRRVCGGPKRFKANPDSSARRLMFILCHLFLRVPLPPDAHPAQFKRSSSTVLLAPLPARLAKEVHGLDRDALMLASQAFGAFTSTLPQRDADHSDAASTDIERKDNQAPSQSQKKKQKKLSKRERKRMETLSRAKKVTDALSVEPETEVPMPHVPYGGMPLSKLSVLPSQTPVKSAGKSAEKSLLRQLVAGVAGVHVAGARSELCGEVGEGEVPFYSTAEAIDGARWGIAVDQNVLCTLGGGPGSLPSRPEANFDTLEGKLDEEEAKEGKSSKELQWDSPRLNAYALDFLKHGQLATIVRDNRVSAGRVWHLLRDWDLLLMGLASALTTMDRSPDYAPTFRFLAHRFRQRFKTLSSQG
eukprot:CAMPEP_0184496812 /NCGR_PEP_ID=MMETSP0113_2-20130426/34938_1 /TAXON_ID=91329 /ORGANISM="Norrisiella sphaerica, Strain BC52" /LENGTH=2353 /DNA_ID=CAMNT_0026883619 /DNA_START=27 /DNA_END=7088 /DNA_ORIENTATION=+